MKNFNQSLNHDLNRIFDFKGENTNEVADFIQPVKEITPRINICRNLTSTNSTGGTIYSVPSDKDFYLISASVSVIKDVTSTSGYTRILATIDGVSQILLSIVGLSLTVQNDVVSIYFGPQGIKIDRGTNITLANNTNVANITGQACIHGYTQETTKGV